MEIACICTDDLSKNKVATQSTTYPSSIYTADNAVDRDITTCMRTELIGVTSPYQTVWWRVDLGRVYNIYSVNIRFRNYDDQGIILLFVYPYKHFIIAYFIEILGTCSKDGFCMYGSLS